MACPCDFLGFVLQFLGSFMDFVDLENPEKKVDFIGLNET
jgi:hypothetical protein